MPSVLPSRFRRATTPSWPELLASPKRSRGGLRPVGWYHSHTRSEIFFSDADLEIHKHFFPEPWQVALVMKPHTFQPTRAGFFFREADGVIRGNPATANSPWRRSPCRRSEPRCRQPYRNFPSVPQSRWWSSQRRRLSIR